MSTTDRAGDIDEFARLKSDDDPRTIEEMIAEDSYEEVIVDKVRSPGEPGGYWDVQWGNGTGTALKPPEGVTISIGDRIRFYGWGAGSIGGKRHGWALNGHLIEWQTPWERFAERVQWLADYDRRKRENFAARKADLDAKYEALPAPLKARIDRFRAARRDFRIDSEAYEMAAVADAPKIARAIARAHGWSLDDELAVTDRQVSATAIEAAVDAFRALSYEQQQRMVPDLDPGHSGNTFGWATRLAYGLLVGEEL